MMFSSWTLLTTPPKTSGRFIVAHRGHAEVIHYLHPEGNYHHTANLGWQKDPREFGATHYMPLSEITDKQSEVAEKDLKTRGLKRVVKTEIHKSNVVAFKPTKWQHFKAAFGWKWMPSYRPMVKTITSPPPVNENDPRQLIKKT